MKKQADTDGNGTVDDTAHKRAGFTYGGQADWQLLEEWDGPTLVAERTRDYVYGNSIDDLIQSRDTTTTTPTVYYHHHDDLFSITATSDGGGAVVERYEYGDYGDRRVFDAAGLPRAVSVLGLRQGFTGQIHDAESRLVSIRNRYLFTSLGRWIQRDPWGMVESGINLLSYAAHQPCVARDTLGLVAEDRSPGDKVVDSPFRPGNRTTTHIVKKWRKNIPESSKRVADGACDNSGGDQ